MTIAPSKTVLLSGFEPFAGSPINPSDLAVRALDGAIISGRRVVSLTLPCVFGRAFDDLGAHIKMLNPELVICVGQATGRSAINLEEIAINLDNATMADNAGAQPLGQCILPKCPASYASTLPLASIERALAHAGIEVARSQSAGSYVCNHVFYRLMHELQRRPEVRGGFIHIPMVPEQVQDMPSQRAEACMPLATIVESLRIAIDESLLGFA